MFELKQVSQLATVLMGQSPPSSSCTEDGQGLPFIQGNAEFGSRNPIPLLRCSTPTRIAEKGDFLLSVRAPVGELNQSVQRMVIGRGLSAIRFPEIDQPFAWHSLKSAVGGLNRVAQGSTFVAVSRQDVENLEIHWFAVPEYRNNVAYVLDIIDEAIAKTEAVIAKLKQVRAGLLHDLLSYGLDEHGQLRDPIAHPEQFKDSDFGRIPREWKVITIKEIATIKTGAKDTQNRIENGNYPFYVRSDVVERINTYSYDGEAILTAGDGVGVGKVVHYAMGRFDYHQRVYNIHNFSRDTCGRFLYYFFKENFFARISKMSAKTSVDSVRMEMIAGMNVPSPLIKEQEKIASALTEFEEGIAKYVEEYNKLRNIKSGLQDDLLTGCVRVPETIMEGAART